MNHDEMARFSDVLRDNYDLRGQNKSGLVVVAESEIIKACDIIDQLLTRVTELEAERAWLPIESAPKDGTKVMLYVGDFLECITASWFWDTSENIWKNTIGQWMVETHITHWMPLPQPPTTKGD